MTNEEKEGGKESCLKEKGKESFISRRGGTAELLNRQEVSWKMMTSSFNNLVYEAKAKKVTTLAIPKIFNLPR